MRKSESDNTWLQPVLRRGLERVPAPSELWDRIVLHRVEVRSRFNHRFVWMLAAASALTVSVLAVAWGNYPAVSYGPGQPVEFTSSQASGVRSWIRNRTGFDIPLLAQSNTAIHMMGASVAETGAVEIRYRAGNQNAVLHAAVLRGSAAGDSITEHRHVIRNLIQSATTVSWTMGRQVYTLSVQRAGGMAVACLVCHTESTL